ncbi:MAG: hypothetical protein ACYC6G_16135 [Desulfobaccales bacterium]
MPKTDLRLPCSWLAGLILIMTLATAPQVWAQPSGMGKSGGMGGLMGGGGMGGDMGGGPGGGGDKGPGGQAQPRFDLNKATTITGQVESLGSYKLATWQHMTGMAVQGLILKTEQGQLEVYLGPPSYVTQQKFPLLTGDTLEVKGFKVVHGDKPAFFAASIKNGHQTLTLLDEEGSPLWKQQDTGGPNSNRAGRGGNDPGQGGGGMMGTGSRGKGR